jgi:hypothetical protein
MITSPKPSLDNDFLFKVTGCALLALAWAWLILKWLPRYAATTQYGIMGELGSNEWIQEPAELHPILKLAADSPAYTFLAGVLVVAWLYLLVIKIQHHPPVGVSQQ